METTAQRCLPMTIVETIFAKLPAKSLLRFQAVSKTYMALIRKPSFCRTHLEQARRNHRSNSFLVSQRLGESSFLASFVDQKLHLEKEIDSETSILLNTYDPKCFCDDMIFILGTKTLYGDEVEGILWNPINNTRREIYYPLTPREIPMRNLGLCHDQAEDDYKVVVVFDEEAYTVYSFKYGTWAALKKYYHVRICCLTGAVYADGKLYWLGYDAPLSWAMICFDPTCDGLKGLESWPEGFRKGYRRPYVINLRGRLCFYGDLRGTELLQFWTMQEGNSWELTICIDKKCLYSFSPLWTGCNVDYRCHMIGDEIAIFIGGCQVHIIYHTLENRILGHGETPHKSVRALLPRDLVLSLASFFTPVD